MKKTIITVCLLFTFIIIYAENPVVIKEKSGMKSEATIPSSESILDKNYIYPVWGFFVDGSAGLSSIENNNLSSEIWNSSGGLGYTFNAGYFRSFGPWIKIKAGIGFSSYNGALTGSGDVTPKQFYDIDNDIYTEQLTLSNIKNTSNPMYLSVPLIFEFGNTNINKLGFYVDLGMKYSFLLSENNKTEGSYATTGEYEQWGVTLENIPELGFYNQKSIEMNEGFQKNNYSLLGGAGITIPISGVVIFKLGITGSLGLKDIGNNRSEKSDQSPITQEVYDFRSSYTNNTLAVTKGSKSRYIGLEFGLYINKLVK